MINQATPAGRTPKITGCYLLVRIYKNPPIWKPEIEEWIADAFYKREIDTPFNPFEMQIRLKPLFNRLSNEFSLTNYDNCSEKLLNTVIQIKEIRLVNSGDYPTYSIDWKPIQEYELNELVTMFPDYYRRHPPVYQKANIYNTNLSPDELSDILDDDFILDDDLL